VSLHDALPISAVKKSAHSIQLFAADRVTNTGVAFLGDGKMTWNILGGSCDCRRSDHRVCDIVTPEKWRFGHSKLGVSIPFPTDRETRKVETKITQFRMHSEQLDRHGSTLRKT